MAIAARIRELTLRHRDLDTALASQTNRPGADEMRLVTLKKEKLRLKDEIALLERRT